MDTKETNISVEEWRKQRGRNSNPRAAKTYTHDGKTMTVAEWAAHLGTHPQNIYRRLAKGLPLEEALRCFAVETLTKDGVTAPIRYWADTLGISYNTIRNRHARGLSDEECLSVTPHKRGRRPAAETTSATVH